jgi:hypothetical protein
MCIFVNAQEDFLSDFDGILTIMDDTIDDGDDAIFIAPVELFKSSSIARLNFHDKLFVGK